MMVFGHYKKMISKTPAKTVTDYEKEEITFGILEVKLMAILLMTLSIVLGFFLGTIYSKKMFDSSAINSGHAQYSPITGNIEWKIIK
jgi:hypothetical protein